MNENDYLHNNIFFQPEKILGYDMFRTNDDGTRLLVDDDDIPVDMDLSRGWSDYENENFNDENNNDLPELISDNDEEEDDDEDEENNDNEQSEYYDDENDQSEYDDNEEDNMNKLNDILMMHLENQKYKEPEFESESKKLFFNCFKHTLHHLETSEYPIEIQLTIDKYNFNIKNID